MATCDVTPPLNIKTLDDLLPQEPLLMMGAGPVPIPARVAAANSIVINHLGSTMAAIIDQVKSMSRYVFQSDDARILGVAGPGSAAMEMAVANLVEDGDDVLSVCNGYFSNRLSDMAERAGARVQRLIVKEPVAADPALVKQYLQRRPAKILTIVQGETSNTVCNHALEEICRVAREFGCIIIVDAVCTLSTMALPMARDLAREGIRVNTILPGFYETPIYEQMKPEVKENLRAHVQFPVRFGQPNEYAQVVEFMCEHGYINAEYIRTDAGARMPPR